MTPTALLPGCMWPRRRLAAAIGAATAATAATAAVCAAFGEKRTIKGVASAASDAEPGLELLVHNISHADIYCLLKDPSLPSREQPQQLASEALKDRTSHLVLDARLSADSVEAEPKVKEQFLARPMFNEFMPISELILERLRCLQEGDGVCPVTSPSRYRVKYPSGLSLAGPDGSDGVTVDPGGASAARGRAGWSRFHLKGYKRHDGSKPELPSDLHPVLTAVYVPLVAVLLPEWLRVISRRQHLEGTPPPKKVLVLVSGAGQPRDHDASANDNSTEGAAKIIQRFVERCYPEIEVVSISSSSSIFRYDDNVSFIKQQVLPVIEAKRNEVVARHGDGWAKRLKVTIALADGAPARISAINASMRSYRPDYLHFWRTKTFWDERVLSEEDVEFHTFKKLEMRPATHASTLPAKEKRLVEDMVRYKRQFEAIRDADEHELTSFWLRKTGKAVVAVLLSQKAGEEPVYWRGMNLCAHSPLDALSRRPTCSSVTARSRSPRAWPASRSPCARREVSMPTGTLCAERNAIGNALAGDQTMSRADMKAIAVLSIPLGEAQPAVDDGQAAVALNPLDPCAPPPPFDGTPTRQLAASADPGPPRPARPAQVWRVHGVAEEDRRGQPRLPSAHVYGHQLREGLYHAHRGLRLGHEWADEWTSVGSGSMQQASSRDQGDLTASHRSSRVDYKSCKKNPPPPPKNASRGSGAGGACDACILSVSKVNLND